jgi:two-component system nitrate/nitrite response regulator NarL
VLVHVVQGSTNKEVARALCIEESTVEVHVSQLLKRSGAQGRSALVYVFWTLA